MPSFILGIYDASLDLIYLVEFWDLLLDPFPVPIVEPEEILFRFLRDWALKRKSHITQGGKPGKLMDMIGYASI